ncbi:MAG: hypothetical protein RXS42_08990 [Nitrososphaeria archaeon]
MRRPALASAVMAIALVILAMAVLMGSYYVYYSVARLPTPAAAGHLRALYLGTATAGQGPGAVTLAEIELVNPGPRPANVTAVVILPQGGPPQYYRYAAVVLPGQNATLYVPAQPGASYGVETDTGVVWARPAG